MNRTDKHWRRLGATAPYFGVITDSRYSGSLSDAARNEFFESGEDHVAHVFSTVRAKVDDSFEPDAVLDFGCGVGRILVPLAERSQHAIGVDVAAQMLQEARQNVRALCPTRSVALLDTDTARASIPRQSLDFVHSSIVFQHIPGRQGVAILTWLIELLRPGGTGALHVTFNCPGGAIRRLSRAARGRSVAANGFANLLSREPWSSPYIEMNEYDMNEVMTLISSVAPAGTYVEWSDHQGVLGATFYFRTAARRS